MFYKIQNLSKAISENKSNFDNLIIEKYGYHYSDENIDEIIDTVDYGHGHMTFRQFDKLMRDNIPKDVEKK